MTRIVAGKYRGRKLQVPAAGTRPTSERVREALFSRLETWDELSAAQVLDLFAGSGALGIEAVSRGAAHATLIDLGAAAINACKNNVAALGNAAGNNPKGGANNPHTDKAGSEQRKFQIQRADAVKYANSGGVNNYTLVFLDPPYDFPATQLTQILQGLRTHLAENALLVVETSTRTPEPNWPTDYILESSRDWGETRVWFVSYRPETESSPL